MVVFTWFNVFVTIFVSLLLVLVLASTVCIHLNLITPVIDLLDVVVLVAIVGMMVDLPVHVLLHYQHHQLKDVTTTVTMPSTFASAPTVSSTSWYMRHALLGPLLLSVLMSLPLFLAQLQVVQKTGEYMFFVVIVAYVASCVFLPPVLAISAALNGRCGSLWGSASCGGQHTHRQAGDVDRGVSLVCAGHEGRVHPGAAPAGPTSAQSVIPANVGIPSTANV